MIPDPESSRWASSIFKWQDMIRILSTFTICFALAYQANGQCFPDRHSTNWFDSWISCEASQSPNPDRDSGHWILYDYGDVYALGQTYVWNLNDPERLGWGIRRVEIDYSTDGETWYNAGTFTLDQAPGDPTYEGEEGPHLNDIEARYLLLTAKNNYGGDPCFGLGELRIEAEEVVNSSTREIEETGCFRFTAYPNPFSEYVILEIEKDCPGDVVITMRDILGRVVYEQSGGLDGASHNVTIPAMSLPNGAYQIEARVDDEVTTQKVIKISR